jgi:hypothetical protein
MQAIAVVRELSEFHAGIPGASERNRNPPATKPGAGISSLAACFSSDFTHKFR